MKQINILLTLILLLATSCNTNKDFDGIGNYFTKVEKYHQEYDTLFKEVKRYYEKNKKSVSFDEVEKGTLLFELMLKLNIDGATTYGGTKTQLVFKRLYANQDYGLSISKDFSKYTQDTLTDRFMIKQIDSVFVLFAEKDS